MFEEERLGYTKSASMNTTYVCGKTSPTINPRLIKDAIYGKFAIV